MNFLAIETSTERLSLAVQNDGHILAFEGDSQVYWFEGSYSEYEENKKKRLGDSGPKRIKYRKIM